MTNCHQVLDQMEARSQPTTPLAAAVDTAEGHIAGTSEQLLENLISLRMRKWVIAHRYVG